MIKSLLRLKHMVLYIYFMLLLTGCECGLVEWFDNLFDDLFRKWVYDP